MLGDCEGETDTGRSLLSEDILDFRGRGLGRVRAGGLGGLGFVGKLLGVSSETGVRVGWGSAEVWSETSCPPVSLESVMVSMSRDFLFSC